MRVITLCLVFFVANENGGKKKRVSLTLKQNVNAIREVENNPTKSKGLIAEELNIPRTTLMNIMKNKKKKYIRNSEKHR